MNEAQTIDRMKAELWNNLMSMIEFGDLTDTEAMEWFNYKCDQWAEGLS